MTDSEYQILYDEVYKELVSIGLRKKLAFLVEHAGNQIHAEHASALAEIERLRGEVVECNRIDVDVAEQAEAQTVEAIAAWCDRMGWDHTGDLIRDGQWKRGVK